MRHLFGRLPLPVLSDKEPNERLAYQLLHQPFERAPAFVAQPKLRKHHAHKAKRQRIAH